MEKSTGTSGVSVSSSRFLLGCSSRLEMCEFVSNLVNIPRLAPFYKTTGLLVGLIRRNGMVWRAVIVAKADIVP